MLETSLHAVNCLANLCSTNLILQLSYLACKLASLLDSLYQLVASSMHHSEQLVTLTTPAITFGVLRW